MNVQRLIIVANRLPFTYLVKQGRTFIQRSSGGLVSSMVSYLERSTDKASNTKSRALWIGTAELSEKRYHALNINELPADEYFEPHPVFLPEPVKTKFYQGFCNDCIWPLFHYFPSYAKFVPDFYEAYVTANEIFCKQIKEVYQPGDVIWIHDYHFMLLPEMLRRALPDASIGFFLHVPFPSFELFRIVPTAWKKAILNGMLGADLVGFHTSDYMQYFQRSVQHVLGVEINGRKISKEDRTITADAFPISIDFNKFFHATNYAAIFEENNFIRKKMAGKKMILSVDRLDYSKALVNRLEAFELFLERNRGFSGKVTYMLLVVPSREIITKYTENKQEIERLVSSINGKFGTFEWLPVLYQYKSVDFTRLAALYFAADVALITPLRDGMNLVAKEFVSTRIDKKGVLILSETAGAAGELKEAIIVNPTDRTEIAEAIHTALTMPAEEQTARFESMQMRIRNYDVVKWAEDFIGQLLNQKSFEHVIRRKEITPVIEMQILTHYQEAKRRLFLLDYDGTLAPFAPHPRQAVPSVRLLELLEKLCGDESNTIVVVSGRKREDLDAWFKTLPVNLVAEHGGFSKIYGGGWTQNALATADWKEKLMSVFEFYQVRCAGSFIEEKTLSLAWHYRSADKELGVIRARELIRELGELADQLGFQLIEGNMVVEARCNNVHKGIGIKPWLKSGAFDFILCAGDDRTDEDMFKALTSQAYSIRVGLRQSYARFNCPSQAHMINFLTKFCPTLTTV